MDCYVIMFNDYPQEVYIGESRGAEDRALEIKLEYEAANPWVPTYLYVRPMRVPLVDTRKFDQQKN